VEVMMELPRAAIITSNKPRSVSSWHLWLYRILCGKRKRTVFMPQAETASRALFFWQSRGWRCPSTGVSRVDPRAPGGGVTGPLSCERVKGGDVPWESCPFTGRQKSV